MEAKLRNFMQETPFKQGFLLFAANIFDHLIYSCMA